MKELQKLIIVADKKSEKLGFLAPEYATLGHVSSRPENKKEITRLCRGTTQEQLDFCEIADAIVTGADTLDNAKSAKEYYLTIGWLIDNLVRCLTTASDDKVKAEALVPLMYLSSAPPNIKQKLLTPVKDLLRERPSDELMLSILKIIPFLYYDKFKDTYSNVDELIDIHQRLINHPSERVRDVAIFNIGSIIEGGNTKRKQILRNAISAENQESDVFAEAAVGLAKLGDKQVWPIIKKNLAHPNVGSLWIEAAAVSGNKSFINDLANLIIKFQQNDKSDNRIQLAEDAIWELRNPKTNSK